MNRIELPHTPAARRLQAWFAAAFMTVTMLWAIDELAASQASALVATATAPAAQG